MSHLTTIYRGENRVFARTLKLSDGTTALPVASLTGARVILLQNGRTVGTFILGTDAEIREGATASTLEYELTSTVSAALKVGPLKLRWTLMIADAEFTVETSGNFIDIILEEVGTIV